MDIYFHQAIFWNVSKFKKMNKELQENAFKSDFCCIVLMGNQLTDVLVRSKSVF